MKAHRLLVELALAATVFASVAQAHDVVWLDFSSFNLNSFSSVNGNSPPTNADVTAVRRQVIANMVEDYAPFDVYFTTFEPANGRHTRLRILGANQGGLFGCAGPSCCANAGMCTGIGSWDDMTVSGAEVYAGSFAGDSQFSGSNATTARIANGISHTASHELGHVLDLFHANAADDSISLGCNDSTCPNQTADQNPTWHIMASGSSWGLTMPQRATRDRFFSIHASRRILYGNFQARNHWDGLANLDDEWWRSDLVYGRAQSPFIVRWFARLSTGTQFGPFSTWRTDGGDAGDVFLTGDVDGDNQDDLVYGRVLGSNTVRWYVRLSTGSGFGPFSVWSNDAGDAGDIFRLADVDGDGCKDLVYGRPLSPTQIRWYVRLSTQDSFGPFSTWSNDAGDEGDIFLIGDVDADGDADLVYGRILSPTQVTWYVRRSNGDGFGPFETWRNDAGDDADLFYLRDDTADGAADLFYGRTISNTQVTWFFRPSTGSSFGSFQVYRTDAGDAGDLFRLGDGNGDGFSDLFYARPTGMTSLTATPVLTTIRWYGRLSVGGAFGNFTTWRSDAGDEGDIFP